MARLRRTGNSIEWKRKLPIQSFSGLRKAKPRHQAARTRPLGICTVGAKIMSSRLSAMGENAGRRRASLDILLSGQLTLAQPRRIPHPAIQRCHAIDYAE